MRRFGWGFLLCVAVVLAASITGCSDRPKEDPVAVVREYYGYWAVGDYSRAYDLLASVYRSTCSREDYVTMERLADESKKRTVTNVSLDREATNLEIDGRIYKYCAEVSVSMLTTRFETGKEVASTFSYTVVSEERAWRLYRPLRDIQVESAREYYSVGRMYMLGKGKDLRLYEAATYFRRGTTSAPSDPYCFWGLGYTYKHGVDPVTWSPKCLTGNCS